MTPEEIRTLISQGEGQRLELKRSLAELETGARAAAAMANTDGGHILFGVRDDGTILGVQIGAQTRERVVQAITDNTDPTLYPSVEYVDLDGRTVIVVTVSRSEDRPHLVRGRAYKRVGAADVQMSRAEYERLLRERPGAEYDGQVVGQATEDDIAWEKVERYLVLRERVTGRRVTIPPQQVLQARGCLVEADGMLRPTIAGLLLFGVDPQAFLSRSYITVVRFRGQNSAHGYYDRRDLMGTLAEMVDAAEAYLWEHIQHGGRVRGLRREDLHEYPRPALRECLVNAVAHRDYSIRGSRIIVSMFEGRIEFNSPGPLPWPVTVENILEQQYSRNPRIVRVLFEMGYIEEIGMGLDNVYRWLAEAGQPEPALRDTGGSFIITLYGLDMEKALAEREAELIDLAALGLNERQQGAIVYLREQGRITNREYRSLFEVSYDTAYRDLRDLLEKGLVKRQGKGRATYYVLSA
ncbi:MAG: DeoR family transcriptional regulator [Chloroflexi bacterium]|nr:DeoR family transcriptional regulator [Chloroflexota bacterium]